MKSNYLNIFSKVGISLIVAMSLMMVTITGCDMKSGANSQIDKIKLFVSKASIKSDGKDSVEFSVSAYNQNGTESTEKYDSAILSDGGAQLPSPAFSTKTSGEYNFRAKVDDNYSEYVTVTAAEIVMPPVLFIETAGKEINGDSDTPVTIYVCNGTEKISDAQSSTPLITAKAQVKYRGQSSMQFPKKSMSLKFIDDAGKKCEKELLGMKAEDEWVLYGPYPDRSLLRNYIGFTLAAQTLKTWQPSVRFCEVYQVSSLSDKIDDKNNYLGVYLAIESISRDKNRLNLPKTLTDTVDGSYIFARDKAKEGDNSFTSLEGSWHFPFVINFPTKKDITAEQTQFITKTVHDFETVLFSPNFADPITGYSKYIDVDSFIDYAIVNDYIKNVDGGSVSAYFYKTAGQKIVLGPIWDMDLSMGNVNFKKGAVPGSTPDGWFVSDSYWFNRLFQDKAFCDKFTARYAALRKTTLTTENLNKIINDGITTLGGAVAKNFQRWPEVFQKTIWPNPDPQTKTYDQEIKKLFEFFAKRGEWVDNNLSKFTVMEKKTYVLGQ